MVANCDRYCCPAGIVSVRRLACLYDFIADPQAEPGLDEILTPEDPDFNNAGLKVSSVLRLGRLAVVDGALLSDRIGEIGDERLVRLRHRLAVWLTDVPNSSD